MKLLIVVCDFYFVKRVIAHCLLLEYTYTWGLSDQPRTYNFSHFPFLVHNVDSLHNLKIDGLNPQVATVGLI